MAGVRLNERDRKIIDFVTKFRCVDRDSLCELFFSDLKTPVNGCNSVMLRLVRLGLVQRTQSYSPTVYMAADAKIKSNSQKILHYLAILDVYKQLHRYKTPSLYIVEDKPGKKGQIEPDLFVLFKGTPFWVEVQRNQYTDAKMQAKINLYEEFFHSDGWRDLHWQRPDRPLFPIVLIITPVRYAVSSDYIRIIQVSDIAELMQKFGGQQSPPPVKPAPTDSTIRINLT